ncbi:dimethyladenosine transferase 1, mitochondrial-like [Glandiceps talaboti]
MTRLRLPPLPTIRDIIRMYGLRAQKQLAQNFLLDVNLTNKIVRSAGNLQDSVVCEVGPGPGGITRSILNAGAKHVTVIEKDRRFIPSLQLLADASEGRMDIICADILKYNVDRIFRMDSKGGDTDFTNTHIIGNLPFNVSTPLIIKWLEDISTQQGAFSDGRRTRMTLTFQKEVAERLSADVGDPQRSRLSIMAQSLCEVQHCFTIPGSAFVPKPEVDVGVVHFIPRIHPLIPCSFKLVEKVVRCVFHFRQKYCKRGVEILFPYDYEDMVDLVFETTGIDPSTTPTRLSIDDFDKICDVYSTICQKYPAIRNYEYR